MEGGEGGGERCGGVGVDKGRGGGGEGWAGAGTEVGGGGEGVGGNAFWMVDLRTHKPFKDWPKREGLVGP